MIDLKQYAAPLARDWKCTVIFAVAFAFACWQSAYQIRSEWGGAAALLVLLACLLYLVLTQERIMFHARTWAILICKA